MPYMNVLLTAGVGDIAYSMLCARTFCENIGVTPRYFSAGSEVLKAHAVLKAIQPIHMGDDSLTVHTLPDHQVRSTVSQFQEVKRSDHLIGPRIALFEGEPLALFWPDLSRDIGELSRSARSWPELYALFADIDANAFAHSLEVSTTLSVTTNQHHLMGANALTIFCSVSANSVRVNVRLFTKFVSSFLSKIVKSREVKIVVHSPPPRASRLDIDDKSNDNISQQFIRNVIPLRGSTTFEIAGGDFDEVAASISRSNIVIAPRSGLSDLAYLLGVPTVSAYRDLTEHSFYRLAPTDKVIEMSTLRGVVISATNIPHSIGGLFQL